MKEKITDELMLSRKAKELPTALLEANKGEIKLLLAKQISTEMILKEGEKDPQYVGFPPLILSISTKAMGAGSTARQSLYRLLFGKFIHFRAFYSRFGEPFVRCPYEGSIIDQKHKIAILLERGIVTQEQLDEPGFEIVDVSNIDAIRAEFGAFESSGFFQKLYSALKGKPTWWEYVPWVVVGAIVGMFLVFILFLVDFLSKVL